jgi:hypothetical protein
MILNDSARASIRELAFGIYREILVVLAPGFE